MYLRHSTVTKNGKTHTYWRLVRAVRVGRKVRQVTVAKERGANNFPISHGLGYGAIVPFGENFVEDDLHVFLESRSILPTGLVDLAE